MGETSDHRGDASDAGDDFDPASTDHRTVGDRVITDDTGLSSAMAHLYRGEMDRATTWRQRLDRTTYWAITLITAILAWAFSSRSNPHYVLLVGTAVVVAFLAIEARRYRGYDIWRDRVRTLEANLFADALDPSRDVEQADWRETLSDDLREPTPKLSTLMAMSHRLRRVYLPLLSLLLTAWVLRVTAFAQRPLPEAAAVGAVPGVAVIGAVAAFYAAVLAVTLFPGFRRVRGEMYETE